MAKSIDKNIFHFGFRSMSGNLSTIFIVTVNCYFVLSEIALK